MTKNVHTIMTKLYSIAGLFHDIGKFAERAEAIGEVNINEMQQHYGYKHAYHTERVLEGLFGERANWYPDNFSEITMLNLASRHHKPRNNYELLVAEADRIAAGHERMDADEASEFDVSGRERKGKVPLISILSRINIKGFSFASSQPNFEDWRYKLRPMSEAFNREKLKDVFPCKASEYGPIEVQKDYKELWNQFEEKLKARVNGKQLDLIDNFETIHDICRDLMWCIPESVRKEDLQDVSLFEHSRITAALSSCLYLYHSDTDGTIAESESKKLASAHPRKVTI